MDLLVPSIAQRRQLSGKLRVAASPAEVGTAREPYETLVPYIGTVAFGEWFHTLFPVAKLDNVSGAL